MNDYIPDRYKIQEKIGEGVHGVVLKAIDTMENNKVVAIKKVALRTKFGGEKSRKQRMRRKMFTETFLNFFRDLAEYVARNKVPAACRQRICKKQSSGALFVQFTLHSFAFQIITLLDLYPDVSGLALVFEFMQNTLYSKLRDEENPLSRQQIQSYMKMLLRGLAYLHDDMNIMHRVSRSFSAYVCDLINLF